MTFYKCGHNRKMIVIDNRLFSMASYFNWKDTTGFEGDRTECWNCYNKRRKLEVGK